MLRFLGQLGNVRDMAQRFKVLGNYTNLLPDKVMAHLQQYDCFSHRSDLKSVFLTAIFRISYLKVSDQFLKK